MILQHRDGHDRKIKNAPYAGGFEEKRWNGCGVCWSQPHTDAEILGMLQAKLF